MSEMVERVARALALADLDDETRAIVDLDAHMLHVRKHYSELARAAIEAMRLAPRDVLTAFVDAETSVDDAETRWNAAIDAALREKQDG